MSSEDPRSITAVVHGIVGNLEEIVKAEIRLVKVELMQVARATGHAGTALVAATVLGQLALGFLLLAVVDLLATRLAPWAAAVIVGGGAALTSIAFLAAGLARLKRITPANSASLVSEGRLRHG